MASLKKRARRDTIIWLAILAGHGLLLVMFLRIEARKSPQARPDAAPAMSFVWLSPPPVSRARDIAPAPASPLPALRRRAAPVAQAPVIPPPIVPAPQATPRVDWQREAQVAVAAAARGVQSAGSNTGAFSPPPQAQRKPCVSPKSSMEWKPPRVGMAGSDGGLHLPYVVLGKRCVLGLGFFGCALGELPPANGHLLDDMHDPNRSRRSVPAVDSCD